MRTVAGGSDDRPGEAPPSGWAEAACLLAGGLGPILFHTFGTLGFEATKVTLVRLLALVLTLGWLARRVAMREGPVALRGAWGAANPAVKGLVLALGGYVVVHLVASLFSVAPSASFWGSYDRIQGLVTVLAWLTLGVAAALVGRAAERRERLATAWVLASLPVCLYGLAQQFRLDPIDWLGRPLGVSSTLGSSTALSTYLAMVAPVGLARAVAAARRLGPTTADARFRTPAARWGVMRPAGLVYEGWVALVVLQVVVLAMTAVRGGGLALLVGLGIAATSIAWRLRAPAWKLTGALFGALLVGSLLVTSVASWSRSSPVESAAVARSGAEWEDSSARQRLLIWGAALATVAEAGWRALVGFGPETQAVALEARFPAELANRFPDSRFDRAHNVLIDQLLTTGFIGVAATLGLWAAISWLGVRVLAASDGDGGLLTAGLLGALAANLAAGFYAFDSSATGLLFWLMTGLLVAPALPRNPSRQPDARGLHRRQIEARAVTPRRRVTPLDLRLRVSVALAAAIVGLALLPRVLSPFMADLYHTQALALRAAEAPAASLAEELVATRWAPERDVHHLALAETYLELARTTATARSNVPSVFEELFAFTPTGRDGLFAAARLALERAAAANPLDPYTHRYLGRLEALWSEAVPDPAERDRRLAAAVERYDRAVALSPNRAIFHDEAGLVLTHLGRADAAIDRYRRAAELDRPTAERVARIGDAEARVGDVAAARASYVQALSLDPRSAAAEHGLALLDRGEGALPSAAEHAERAVRLDMRNWLYHRDLALVYRDLEDWPRALAEARAARRFAPAWEWDELAALTESVRR